MISTDSIAAVTLTGATVFCTLTYMLADRAANALFQRIFKTLAATGYCALAVVNGAMDSGYGTAVLVALVLSWFGDVALLSRATKAFMGGLFAFLLGHFAFSVAFLLRGVETGPTAIGAIVMTAFLVTGGRWFIGKAPAALRWPVTAYVTVIAVMGALAIGTSVSPGGALIAGAALAFMLSDVFVGVDRFVHAGWRTRWGGTVLYFAAQLAFAWSVVR